MLNVIRFYFSDVHSAESNTPVIVGVVVGVGIVTVIIVTVFVIRSRYRR